MSQKMTPIVAFVVAAAALSMVACQKRSTTPQPPTLMDAPSSAASTELSGVVEAGVRIVTVRARQFEFIPNKIVVRQGEKVRLDVTSEDVTHGIAIDEYKINRTLNPHKKESVEFTADKPGIFVFYCSVYCGMEHANMRGQLVVLPAAVK